LSDDPHPLGQVEAPVTIPETLPPEPEWSVLTAPSLPATFDLRRTKKLPAVRDQGGCGSCWTFAALGSSESALLPKEPLDLSEEHMNLAHAFDIPACQGGNAPMATAYLARGAGPVGELDAPYTGTVRKLPSGLVPKKYLKEALNFPNRVNATDNDTLKAAVVTYGAVYTTMRWSNDAWNASTSSFFDPGPRSSANHAVLLVGWDDNYSATRFTKVPKGNGAFLVRNSWGPGFGDRGYFWISYHDAYVGRDNAAFVAFAAAKDYDKVYQHDTYGQTTAVSYGSATTYSGNIFTATESGTLAAVGYYTTAPQSSVQVKIYDDPGKTPSSGKLLGSRSATVPWAGYHTIAGSTLAIPLRKGQRFGVVVRVVAPAARSYVSLEYPFAGYSSKVVAKAGRSFVGIDGKLWVDTATTWRANAPVKVFAKRPSP